MKHVAINTNNACNTLNKAAALQSMSVLCSMIATFFINTGSLRFGLEGQEGTPQGDPLLMSGYEMSLILFISALQSTTSFGTQIIQVSWTHHRYFEMALFIKGDGAYIWVSWNAIKFWL